MKSDLPSLAQIADSITAIETYVAGGRDAYLRERLIQDAVIRNFEDADAWDKCRGGGMTLGRRPCVDLSGGWCHTA